MSKNTLLSELINYISANSSGNVVIAAPSSGYALDVTGTGRFTGALSGTSANFTSNVNVGGSGGTGGVFNIYKSNSWTVAGDGYTSIYSGTGFLGVIDTTGSTDKRFYLSWASLTSSTLRTYTLPDASGTLALTSNLSAYLPLTGGTLSGTLFITNTAANNALYITNSNAGYHAISVSNTGGGSAIYASGSVTVIGTGYFSGVLTAASLANTTGQGFTLPSSSGTLALTSQLSSYLPLSGGTLTGALSGTSATFSGAINLTGTANSFQVASIFRNANRVFFGGDTGGYYFQNSGNTATVLQIADTGAATFSSSVTATTIGINTSTLNSKLSVYKSDVSSGNSPASSGTTAVNGLAEFVSNRGQGLYIGSQYSGDYGVWLQVSDKGNLGVNYPLLLQPNGGNVGIGTTSPQGKLDVQSSSGAGSTTASGLARFVTATTSKAISIGQSDSGRRLDLDSYSVLGNGEDLYVGTTSANALIAYVNSSERMRITSSGNVGIGTTTISTNSLIRELVIGQGITNGVSKLSFRSESNSLTSDISLSSYLGENIMAISTTSNIPMLFVTNSTERMRITSGGYVKASNSGSYYSVSADYHELRTTVGDAILRATNTSTNPYGISVYFTGADPNNTSLYVYNAVSSFSGTSLYSIWSNGTTSGRSDARLKKNIVDSTPKLDKLMQLRIVNYEWKESLGGSKELGLIAQEVEEIFPNLIITEPVVKEREIILEDGTKEIEKYEDGDYKSLKNSVLPYITIKALQELTEEVRTLKAELDTLKNK